MKEKFILLNAKYGNLNKPASPFTRTDGEEHFRYILCEDSLGEKFVIARITLVHRDIWERFDEKEGSKVLGGGRLNVALQEGKVTAIHIDSDSHHYGSADRVLVAEILQMYYDSSVLVTRERTEEEIKLSKKRKSLWERFKFW